MARKFNIVPKLTNRKLKRNVSQETIPVTVESVKCIRGGMRKHWCVLETTEHLGRECVSIKSTQKWLHSLVNGQLHNSRYHNAISNFVSDCVEAFDQKTEGPSASSQGAPPVPLEDQPAGASTSSQAALAGRAAIFRDRTPDSEDEAPAIVPKKARRVSTTRASSKGWATISVRGMEITCYAGRGRQLLVPVDTGDVDRIVQHLLPKAGEDARASESNFITLLEESDVKLIWWRKAPVSSQGCGWWVVNYTDNDGNAGTFRSGLMVPRKNLAGEMMEQQEQMDAASKVLVKARREWNRLDCSDRARFEDEVV